ncbi:caspase recruitment domain-containing protein 9 isoform X2 [Brienomyrus brachyistius]|uniref:caspase recruitment domain-containing protein 9 isoform X2 n=1 Tax=Brienomyrus brachyistius TaxID=42636 RepID=UPI0020B29CEB|nr:caspase recruitment domain-containing protein 9 isoform X2 [Brienomyrus brachyistius]
MSITEDEECWVQLEDYRLLLIKTIEPSRITPYLRQCKVLSSEDEEQIFNDPSLVIRRRKVGMLLDILQRTGHKGYVAFLESLELDYPQLYRKITGKEPARVFSILVDTAGESGLTQFLMSEMTRLQKALQEERLHRQEVSARMAAQQDTIRQQQVRESELRKQQERVCRMREERDKLVAEARHLKDENYNLLRDVTRLTEEKSKALMDARDLQMEIERLKHSLMNAESDSKIQRKRTVTLKNAMEMRPSQDAVWHVEKENDLLKCRTASGSAQAEEAKLKNQCMEFCKQRQAQHQELVNSLYALRRELRSTEELRDKYMNEKEVWELQCTLLEKDCKMYRNRMEDIVKQMEEVIAERDKAIRTREEYHMENCQNIQAKDQYRKQIQELGERCDELQVQLFRTQGKVISLEGKLRQTSSPASPQLASDIEDGPLQSWLEKSQTSEEEIREMSGPGSSEEPRSLLQDNPHSQDVRRASYPLEDMMKSKEKPNRRPRIYNFNYRRQLAVKSKTTCKKEFDLDNTSGSDNTDTEGTSPCEGGR